MAERLDEVRLQRQRAIVAGQRRAVAAQRRMDDGQQIQRAGRVGIGRQYFEAYLLGLGELSRIVGFQGDIEGLRYRQ